MGITRQDLIGEMTDEERASRQTVLNNYMANDAWAKRAIGKIGILLTSHPGNRAYLKASIETHKKLGLWICLAYDNYLHPELNGGFDYNSIMPAKDVMDNVDTFIMPHYQKWGGVLYPYFWLMKWGVSALQDFEYIYCTNGDFILEKPEGFEKLFSLIGDADIMTCGHDEPGKYANTAGFIAKSSALKAIMKHIQDHFIPFDIYEKYTQGIGNAEGRLGRAIKDLGLKQVIVEPPSDDMLKIPGTGRWYHEIGFRHIHAEHNYAYRYKGLPPEAKWLDPRFMGDEYSRIKEYWKTKDTKILEDWWAKQ